MKPPGENIYRAAIGVVGRVDDELIVDSNPRRGGKRVAVIRLDDLLEAGMRQLPVADEDAQSAGIEKGLMHAGNAVDDAGKADRIVRPAPLLAVERNAAGNGAVDIGEFVRLDVAVGPAGADESAEIGRDFLLDIHADAAAALILADGGDIGRAAGDRSQCDRVLESSHAAAGEETGDCDLARMAPQIVAALDFADPLDLRECRIEFGVVRDDREIEQAAAQGPVALVPLGGGAVGIAPGVGGIIERCGVDERPIHEIVARIVRIFVGVEDIDNTESLPTVRTSRLAVWLPANWSDAGIHFLRFPAQIDRLANESARQSRIGIGLSDFVGFSTR